MSHTLLSKEEILAKIVKAGFQMDYDRMDNLVDVFKQDEVVENIMFEVDGWQRQEAIGLLEFIGKGHYRYLISSNSWTNPMHDYFSHEYLYNLYKSKQQ